MRYVYTIGKTDVYGGPAASIHEPDIVLDLCKNFNDGVACKVSLQTTNYDLQTFEKVEFDIISVWWPDFGIPIVRQGFWETLVQWLTTLDDKRRLYVCCHAGVGRTGTALCLLAHFSGLWPDGCLVSMCRERYNVRAVETPEQKEYIERITGRKIRADFSSTDLLFIGRYK